MDAEVKNQTLRIGSVGMITPVGLSFATSCAALRAGISRLQELPIAHPLPQPVIGAYVPILTTAGFDRLLEMLTQAVRECMIGLIEEEMSATPLLIGTAIPDRPDSISDIESELIGAFAHRLQVSFHPRYSRVFNHGRASVFTALVEARRLLLSGEVKRCLVAGVDSLVNLTCIGWLYRNQRLKLQDNSDGLMPGEAAAALEILPATGPPAYNTSEIAIVGLGCGNESAAIMSGQPNLAEGLTQAVRNALMEASMTLGDVDFRLSDVNGEQYYFRETANVLSRLLRDHKDRFPIWHCADSIGDVGAAVGAVLLGIAVAAFRKSYAPGPTAICQTSSDSGERAAVIVRHTA